MLGDVAGRNRASQHRTKKGHKICALDRIYICDFLRTHPPSGVSCAVCDVRSSSRACARPYYDDQGTGCEARRTKRGGGGIDSA